MDIPNEELRPYACPSDRLIKGSVRGVAVELTGLGGTRTPDTHTDRSLFCAGRNTSYLLPYINPRAWTDKAALVKALGKKHEVTYITVPGRGHCDLMEEARGAYDRFILAACGAKGGEAAL